MIAHLLKDVINGTKLIVLSGTAQDPTNQKIRFFIGGTFLIIASSFTIYASTTYNWAIATSNTELITNAVIILFITDIDEMVDEIVMAIGPSWASEEEKDGEEQGVDGTLALLRSENLELKGKMEELGNNLALQTRKNSAMEESIKTLSEAVERKEFQEFQEFQMVLKK